MKEVQFLNRDTTASEPLRIPKSIKEQVLFRKNWFKQTIVDSVLQMKKTKELKEFELFLYQNNLVTEKEHSDYMNNIPFKPKTLQSEDRKRIQSDEPIKDNKHIHTEDDFPYRLNNALAAVHTESSHSVLVLLDNYL